MDTRYQEEEEKERRDNSRVHRHSYEGHQPYAVHEEEETRKSKEEVVGKLRWSIFNWNYCLKDDEESSIILFLPSFLQVSKDYCILYVITGGEK